MNKSHILEKCTEAVREEFAFFETPPLITSVSDSMIVSYPPVSALDADASTLKFIVPGNEDTYIDMNQMLLYVKGKIVTATGTDMAANAKIAPVNNFLYAIFSSTEMAINGKLVTPPNAHHSYIPYFH